MLDFLFDNFFSPKYYQAHRNMYENCFRIFLKRNAMLHTKLFYYVSIFISSYKGHSDLLLFINIYSLFWTDISLIWGWED